MSDLPNGLSWTVRDHEKRIGHLEQYDLAVLANRMTNVEKGLEDVRTGQVAQTRILWTIAVALIAAALTLAVSIATGTLGGG